MAATEPAADTAWAIRRAKEIVETVLTDTISSDVILEYVKNQLLLAHTEGHNVGMAKAGDLAKKAWAKYYGDGPEPSPAHARAEHSRLALPLPAAVEDETTEKYNKAQGKYRKKPIEIEAFCWTGGLDQLTLTIVTLEGSMSASPGDWIIRGVKGEIYPCKPDIFAATYDSVTPLTGDGPEPEGGLPNI